MKWSELTLKERKQIYDTVRAENPNASYFDIREQFNNIPEYEDGKDSSNVPNYSLPEITIYPQNKFGDIARSQGYTTARNWQTVKQGTTAGINQFVNDPRTQFVLATVPLPSGLEEAGLVFNAMSKPISKGVKYTKELLQDVTDILDSAKAGTSLKEMLDPRFSAKRKYLEKAYSNINETAEAIKNANIVSERNINNVKNQFSNQQRISFAQERIENGNFNAKISRVRDVQDYGPVVDDYVITIDPLQYLPGTANHELGHLADQLASDANNRYLTYLLDEGNIMGPGELRSKGINIGSDMQSYLLDPSESKSHMLHLKRALVNEGKIHDWSSKVNQNTIEDFLFDPRNTGVVNNANKLQYNMYRNKSRFVDRINNLTPMEFITPLLLPVAGYEINKE